MWNLLKIIKYVIVDIGQFRMFVVGIKFVGFY